MPGCTDVDADPAAGQSAPVVLIDLAGGDKGPSADRGGTEPVRNYGWWTRPKPARSSHQIDMTDTLAPEWGALTMSPLPMYMPT